MDRPKKVVFTKIAFLKALLHACQHPTNPVYGVLLAKADGDAEVLRIERVAPLFHMTPLGPLLEVAMTMIMKDCETFDLVPVGLYYGGERFSEETGSRHAEAIAANFGGKGAAIKCPLLAVIKASGLADPAGQPLELFEKSGSAFSTVTNAKLLIEELASANEELTGLLASDARLCETDFNDHILTTADWPVLELESGQ